MPTMDPTGKDYRRNTCICIVFEQIDNNKLCHTYSVSQQLETTTAFYWMLKNKKTWHEELQKS